MGVLVRQSTIQAGQKGENINIQSAECGGGIINVCEYIGYNGGGGGLSGQRFPAGHRNGTYICFTNRTCYCIVCGV